MMVVARRVRPKSSLAPSIDCKKLKHESTVTFGSNKRLDTYARYAVVALPPLLQNDVNRR